MGEPQPCSAGGGINWDYRYCWRRDSTFALGALINAGYHDEARQWRDWLLRAVAGSPNKMNIMYRVDGGRDLRERTVDTLPGYRYATQFQLDVWGEVLDSLDLAERAGLPGSRQTDVMRVRMVEHLLSVLARPAPECGNRAASRGITLTPAQWPGLASIVSCRTRQRKKPPVRNSLHG
jgi:hypothetical protein